MFVRNGQAVGSVLHSAEPTPAPKPKKRAAAKPKAVPAKAVPLPPPAAEFDSLVTKVAPAYSKDKEGA